MRQFFVGTLALELEHAALGHQRGDAGHAQFGGFFDQPVHAVVGGDAGQQMHCPPGFSLQRNMGADRHLHIAAAHAGHGRCKLAAFTIEQRDAIAGLHAQHLHMARCAGRQVEAQAGGQRSRAIKTRHAHMRP